MKQQLAREGGCAENSKHNDKEEEEGCTVERVRLLPPDDGDNGGTGDGRDCAGRRQQSSWRCSTQSSWRS